MLNSRHFKLSQHDLNKKRSFFHSNNCSRYLLPNDYLGLIEKRWAMSPLTPNGITVLFCSSTLLPETKSQCQPWLTAQLICHFLIWSGSHGVVIRQAQIFPKKHPALSNPTCQASTYISTYAMFFFDICPKITSVKCSRWPSDNTDEMITLITWLLYEERRGECNIPFGATI